MFKRSSNVIALCPCLFTSPVVFTTGVKSPFFAGAQLAAAYVAVFLYKAFLWDRVTLAILSYAVSISSTLRTTVFSVSNVCKGKDSGVSLRSAVGTGYTLLSTNTFGSTPASARLIVLCSTRATYRQTVSKTNGRDNNFL